MHRQGKFGPISIHENRDARLLLLNSQVQGGSYFTPSAASVDDALPSDAPGPISISPYALGWLLAGIHDPQATAVMTGLGSGAGAVQLLAAFPNIDLTVVEIDPVMVQMALKSFPLINWYMNRGRLNVVIKDAGQYFRESSDVFDFACVDSYTGGATLEEDYLPMVAKRAKEVYINLIDKHAGVKMLDVMVKLQTAGNPVTELFQAGGSQFPRLPGQRMNWIMTTQDIDWDAVSQFQFFPEDTAPTTRYMAAQWDHLITHSEYC